MSGKFDILSRRASVETWLLIRRLYRDLANRPLVEILCRDLDRRPCREFAQRPWLEICCLDLAKAKRSIT